jgi:hypothetical protein
MRRADRHVADENGGRSDVRARVDLGRMPAVCQQHGKTTLSDELQTAGSIAHRSK